MSHILKQLILVLVIASCGFDQEGNGDDIFVIDPGTSGIGGSTARFRVSGDFLYVVNRNALKVIDVSNERNPELLSETDLGWGIETIFPYKEHLFIGGQAGMQIYRMDGMGNVSYVSDFQHTTACDPVIANDRYAYVTIRSGIACQNFLFESNQLITLDISDIFNPKQTSAIQMINPRGLTFFKGDLYVAEGVNGLKKFTLQDPAQPELVTFYDTIPANDMISLETTMIITRDEGIFQFGCEDDRLLLYSPL